MSNSLNKKLRGKTIKIFGPPGTGKTENLLKRVQRFLKQGIQPEEICYISFTNKAVDECVSRIRKKFSEYDEDRFTYFRTLHSLARQQFGEIVHNHLHQLRPMALHCGILDCTNDP